MIQRLKNLLSFDWSKMSENRNNNIVLLIIITIIYLLFGCTGTIRWRRDQSKFVTIKDSSRFESMPIRKDTVNRQIMNLLDEEYALLANLVIGNIVKSQQAVYEGRYREAERLLLQAQLWLASPDVLIALGNVYEVQGQSNRADSCWTEAWKLDSLVERRAIRLPRKPWQSRVVKDSVGENKTSGSVDGNNEEGIVEPQKLVVGKGYPGHLEFPGNHEPKVLGFHMKSTVY